MANKPMTAADVRQMLKEQRAAAPAPAPAPAAPQMTAADLRLMLKGLPFGDDAAKPDAPKASQAAQETSKQPEPPAVPKKQADAKPPVNKGKK